jgi:hypothetical protein
MIEARRLTLAKEESARLAREQEEASARRREAEEAARKQTPEYWSTRIEKELRRLAARHDRLDSLVTRGYSVRAQDEAWPEVQSSMRELCSTITTMRDTAPSAEKDALNLLFKSIAYADGDKAAGDARALLGNYLKGDCNQTMPWMKR